MADANQQRDRVIGLIAVLISAMLIMGASMFTLLAWSMPPGKPLPFTVIPAFSQLALGVLGVVAGLLLMRGFSSMKIMLGVVAIAVVANIGFLIVDTALRGL